MRTYDLTPLFRTSVGFDGLSRLMDAALQLDSTPNYPPYNIVRTGENEYRITLAVAGFSEDDLNVTAHENTLKISGKLETADKDVEYLYRGLASRQFERVFQLADHVKVVGAELVNGLLHVSLVREVPEALKPRTIEIRSSGSKQIAAAAK